MEENIKRSETIVKKNRDDWVDEKGFLHTKFTKEVITGPMDNVQASRTLNTPLIPSIINSIRRRRPIQQPVQQVQPQQMPQPDINALINMGKKLMEESGIDFQELMKNAFKNVSEDSLEDKVEPLDKDKSLTNEKEVKDTKWQKKTKKHKPLKKQLKQKVQKTKKKTNK